MVMNFNARSAAGAAALGCLLALAGCSSLPSGSVPVEDRSIYSDGARSESARPATLGSVRDSGRTHQVAYGDTLYNISARYGLDTRELAQLNGISDPTQLRLGQVLHLPESVTEPKPMTIASGVRISRLEAGEPPAETTPAPAADAEQGSAPAEKTSLTNTPSEPSKEASAAVQTTKPIQPAVPGTKLIWPARGPILSDFAKNGKGLDIGGKVGSIVVAAGAGQVLFVGDGVKGYGNLVIIKHSPTIVTAYGHNSKIVVKVGQSVKAGQKIAELGQSDASEPMLRFEVRDKGKPVDPMRFMAPRR